MRYPKVIPSRRQFFHQMLKGFASVSALQLLDLEKLLAAPAQYDYFIGIMPHSLALLKPGNDLSNHGDFFNGYGNWRFNGPGTLSGLDPIRANVFVPRGLTYRMNPGTEGVGHFQAQGQFLTGYPTRSASTYDALVGASNTELPPASVQSIDWMIARSRGKEPVAFGYRDRPGFNGAEAPHFFKAISWRDPSNALYPTFDSAALFNHLKNLARCNTFTSDPGKITAEIAKEQEKKKLLERVTKQYGTFYKNHRSNADAFEKYLDDFAKSSAAAATNIANLESQKSVALNKPGLCDRPGLSFSAPVPSENDNGFYEAKVRELNSLVALALKGGVTNAVTMSICLEKNHLAQHYIARTDAGRDGFTEAQIQTHAQFLKEYMDSVTRGLVHLVNELKAQGIFERTLILVGGEQNDGNTHTAREAPALVIDGKSGSWNGRDVGTLAGGNDFSESRPYSDLLVDILRKFGFELGEFGSAQNVKGVGRGGVF